MHPSTFHPKERTLAKSAHPGVAGLRVVDGKLPCGTHVFISCWDLTDQDMERLKNTRKIYVMVMGDDHPPILPTVHPEDAGI